MTRKRFNRVAICNSYNYEVSKKSHKDYIREQHIINAEIITVITKEIIIKRQAYINVFGTLVPISDEELLLHKTLNVIYK